MLSTISLMVFKKGRVLLRWHLSGEMKENSRP
jgi:hypothetical protein